MKNTERNLNIWISEDNACELLGIKAETLRKNCASGKYVFKVSKRKKNHIYKVMLSSLPVEFQNLYSKSDNDLAEGLMLYNSADEKSRKLADKYIHILNTSKNLRGQALMDYIDDWNIQNPDFRTSYSRLMEIRKKYELYGIAGLISNPHGNSGKTKLQREWIEYFKQLYLLEGAPTAESCHRIVKGCFGAKNNDFPSARTFLRKLQREVPKQSIYLARYGYSKWNKKYANYIERDYSNVRSGQCWVSDHAQIDVAVINKEGKVCFPWVTAWRDLKSNKWLGWLLHEESGNSDHIFQTFYYSALKYGLPDEIYIDNGKDYRAKDFAGGRTKLSDHHSTPMLGLLGVEARFSLPYNAQTKPIERDFKKVKELLSKHVVGYRGGNVVERPEKLKNEISGNKLLTFTEFKLTFDDFIENIMNKLPSKSKKLRGKSPDELFAKEFTLMKTVPKDSLMLFCMRSSKIVTIGRNGIRDSQLGVNYWSGWMSGFKGEKVYIRRDIDAYQECWVFTANTDKFIGKGNIMELVPALTETDIEKSILKKATKLKKADYKAAKTGANVDEVELSKKVADLKRSIDQRNYELNPKLMKLSNNQMDKAVRQARELELAGSYDLKPFVPKEQKKRKIYLFESDKRADLERGILCEAN
ncbi:MAG: transposase domain-containing protein [Candidatus Gastranaerophilales bacterium]|nr:transposase domain-containing protein [Candidatus Gastranaerophilales bacterium]